MAFTLKIMLKWHFLLWPIHIIKGPVQVLSIRDYLLIIALPFSSSKYHNRFLYFGPGFAYILAGYQVCQEVRIMAAIRISDHLNLKFEGLTAFPQSIRVWGEKTMIRTLLLRGTFVVVFLLFISFLPASSFCEMQTITHTVKQPFGGSHTNLTSSIE